MMRIGKTVPASVIITAGATVLNNAVLDPTVTFALAIFTKSVKPIGKRIPIKSPAMINDTISSMLIFAKSITHV